MKTKRPSKKAKRRRFEVYFAAKRWFGREVGGEPAMRWAGCAFDHKRYAVQKAVAYARVCRPSQLFIKGRDGKVQDERTYGADPRRTRG